VVVTGPEQLSALGQAGVVEVRARGSRLPKATHPDGLLFALEPAPGLGFADVAEAAFALRAALLTAQLASWVMTTGERGLKVVVPLAPRYTWTTTRGVADLIARVMADAAPARYGASGANGARVAIDTSMNAEDVATPLPYSPRMLDRPGDASSAPPPRVAMPVDWDDLRALDPGELTTSTVPKLLAKQRRPPWTALLDEAQALPRALLDAVR
jgi:bifunctional non-homologous end joining protein LigD